MEQNVSRGVIEIEQEKQLMVRPESSLFFDIAKFEHAKGVAKIFAESDMVPEHFRDKVGNCIIALNLAERFKADPFMIMQNIYIVHGKPGIEGKLVIALVNSTGKFTALQFKIKGEGEKATCLAYATRIKTDELCEGPVASIAMAKAEGWYKDKKARDGSIILSKWKTMPGLMLRYRAATFFARTFCPEALLGMQTKEELIDVVDVTPGPDGTFSMPETPQSAEDLTEKLKDGADPEPEEKKADIQTEIEKKNAEAKKQAEVDAEFRKEWIDLKKGFVSFVMSELDRFREASPAIQKEAKDKWFRLIKLGSIEQAPWPLDQLKEDDQEKINDATEGQGVEGEITNWNAYRYLFGDPDFESFKKAYENLGHEVYQRALNQLGWNAVATSEECREIAKRMNVLADLDND